MYHMSRPTITGDTALTPKVITASRLSSTGLRRVDRYRTMVREPGEEGPDPLPAEAKAHLGVTKWDFDAEFTVVDGFPTVRVTNLITAPLVGAAPAIFNGCIFSNLVAWCGLMSDLQKGGHTLTHAVPH